jgi:hypothetical protein
MSSPAGEADLTRVEHVHDLQARDDSSWSVILSDEDAAHQLAAAADISEEEAQQVVDDVVSAYGTREGDGDSAGH